jgi:DOMON domain
MSFGVSGDTENSLMIGGDVIVAWVNRLTGKGYAQDYFLEAKSQCSGNRGSCPDTRLKDNTNSIRLLNAAIVNDYSIVTYQRPLKAADAYDQNIFTNGSQAIIWAIGPLNQRFEVSYHTQFLKKNRFIDFGRQPYWNCPIPENEGKPLISEPEEEKPEIPNKSRPQSQKLNQQNVSKPNERVDVQKRPQQPITPRPVPTPKPVSKRDAWEIPPIQCFEPEDGVFYAQMGPTGGKMGYPAITGN